MVKPCPSGYSDASTMPLRRALQLDYSQALAAGADLTNRNKADARHGDHQPRLRFAGVEPLPQESPCFSRNAF
jgi:hypothetical protein